MSITASVESLSLDADEQRTADTIKLISKDGTTYEVERKHAFISQLVKTSLEHDNAASELDLTTSGPVLKAIVDYMQHHAGVEPPLVEKPLKSKIMRDVCKDSWDADWIDRIGSDRQFLYELILAANYMHINSLLHLGCAKVGSLIKGQPLDKIKDILAVDHSSSLRDGTALKSEHTERKE